MFGGQQRIAWREAFPEAFVWPAFHELHSEIDGWVLELMGFSQSDSCIQRLTHQEL